MQEFESLDQLKKASASGQLLVIHFWADWAPQCQQMNTVMMELSKLFTNVKFGKVLAESVPEASEAFEIVAVPTVVLIKDGKAIDRVNGANAAELSQKVKANAQSIPAATPAASSVSATSSDMISRLKKLINAAPVMLFMKGTADEPRCGFSRRMVELLREKKIEFSTFDILGDEEVRENLKDFSNWPTYPQLYADGELIGGLDIVKVAHATRSLLRRQEMAESGDLDDLVKPKSQADLHARLRKLINLSKVMLFMKGTPDNPRCGFSRTIVGILRDENVPFEHYDILGDNEVRQGLKEFSNWPTFPQLYVNGELLGGLDIVKEMQASGELRESLEM